MYQSIRNFCKRMVVEAVGHLYIVKLNALASYQGRNVSLVPKTTLDISCPASHSIHYAINFTRFIIRYLPLFRL